jgi:hypothetical protein
VRISKTTIIWLLLLAPLLTSPEEQKRSQFIGAWCTNACFYGSTSRPWNLPCAFEITEDEIRWAQWDDKQKKFVRKYIVIEQKEDEEILLVYGGGEYEWYAHESVPNAKHKLTFLVNHSNKYAGDSIRLDQESWSEENKGWIWTGSGYIRRNEGSCP